MVRKKSLSPVVAIGVSLVFVLGSLLAACSQPAPSPSPTASPSPKPSPSPAASPTAAGTYPAMIQNAKMPDALTLMGGGSPDSGYTLIAKAIENSIRKYWPKIGTRVELSDGPQSLQRVNDNTAFEGVITLGGAMEGWEGVQPRYKQPLKNLNIMAVIPSGNAFMPVVLKDSPIQDLSQIKNKRLIAAQTGSTAYMYGDILLQAGYGFGYKDIQASGGTVTTAAHDDEASMLLEGTYDVGFYFLTNPQAAVLRIASSPKGMRFLPVSDKALEALWAKPWGETRGLVSKSAYPGLTADFTATTTSAFVIFVNPNTPDDVVYNMLVAVFEDDAAQIKAMHPVHKTLDYFGKYAGKEYPIPYHPGAKKFWTEVWKMRGLK